MKNYIGRIVIGACSLCGGDVTVAEMWASITPDIPRCQQCGATAKKPEAKVIPMERTTIGVTRRDGMTFRPEPGIDVDKVFLLDLNDPKLQTAIAVVGEEITRKLDKFLEENMETK